MSKKELAGLDKYRIKGKTYYKLSEQPLEDKELDFITAIWNMTNTKGDELKLVIRHGSRSSSYIMYNKDGLRLFDTYSISYIEWVNMAEEKKSAWENCTRNKCNKCFYGSPLGCKGVREGIVFTCECFWFKQK